jgi:hypothetical protein
MRAAWAWDGMVFSHCAAMYRVIAAQVNGQPVELDAADGSLRLPLTGGPITFAAIVAR